VQWKAVLRPGNHAPAIDSVLLNYLPKNVAPVIESLTVQTGLRFNAARPSGGDVLNLGSASSASPRTEPTPSAVRDQDSIAVRWSAHDDNDDRLIYTLYYRGDGETRWKLLRYRISDKYYSFDANLLPDGGYTLKLVASDAPSHSPGEALTDEQTSRHFEVDTTPPRIEGLSAVVDAQANALRVSFRALDDFSAIKRAEYSVDAGEWGYIEPQGGLSDSRVEEYRLVVPLASVQAGSGPPEPSEHTVVIRVWDRFDNMGTAKAVVGAK
jgi:hypothetical protein